MRVSVDSGRCCGSGQCVLAAPDVFDQNDEDGTVLLLDPHPPAPLQETVRAAAGVCPAAAITVSET